MRNSIMKKRIMALTASAVIGISASAGSMGITVPMMTNSLINTFAANSVVNINTAVGYAEGMYATWGAVSGADGYNVYVDGIQIDSMLIRQYSGYMRADAVGLKEGNHTLKIVPIINGKEDASKAAQSSANVYAHDRSGYGFVGGSSSGAYNDDGTLKSDAIVVYVTEETKDTVTANLNVEGKGEVACTGIQNIILGYKKGKETRPIAIRIIGNITDPSVLTKGDLYLDTVTAGMTVEGIGNDATFNGFGLVMKNCVNVEVRNIGFMNCNSEEGDDCGLQQGNSYCWVHNCDFFYGDAGSDADQVKGDGALDTKKSHNVTHSYNHFFDNGKCNLQGANSSDTSNYITYHHNWYDHSDSRHPRVRVATVHVYNNYYDGNAKYGIGSTTGSSIFAENNYFRNCKEPMLISAQGSEGGLVLSGETGGMIKAYGNIIEGAEKFVPYSENNTDFDAYVVSSRDESVPSSVKSKSGGNTYNNFDTASDFYSYSVDAAEDVPSIVMSKAGRVDGGDFKWEFDNAVDDTSYAVNDALKAALIAYDDSILAIGSGFKEDVSNPPQVTTASSSNTTEKTTTKTTTVTSVPVVSGGQVHNFTANGTDSSFYTITGNLSSSKGTVSYDGKTLTQCLKMESSTNVSFNAGSAGKLTLVFVETVPTIKVDGKKYTGSNGVIEVELTSGLHTITKADTANLFYMIFGGSAGSVSSSSSQNPSQNTTTVPVVTDIPSPIIPSEDIKVVYAGGWNEMAYLVCSGLTDASVTGVSYSGASSGNLTGDDFEYLVRDVAEGVRVDLLGLKPGTYSITLDTTKGKVTQSGIVVGQQDRSGYAHFNYDGGVGAYTDGGELKLNAKVLYITEENKNTVSVTSKDGTTVKGIGNILNSVGQDIGTGKNANGGTANTNSGIIKKLAEDGTPLVIRIVGTVTAPDGLTVFDSVDMGGSKGDNGFMARMKSGKDITIEGVGSDAEIDGWGFHFMAESSAPEYGKSFEVRNVEFHNVPEDCIGMEGVQEGSSLTASVERCWIHNCEFYVPHIANPAESDKAEGDGACDFKRGMYFTNSYCYYEGYHKTNLVGASDSNLQYMLTYHHNYWKDCESRGPLARKANIHMYNNVFDGQTSYCMNTRADAYIFSEYNAFMNSKNTMRVDSGAIKSYNDEFTNNRGTENNGTIVTDKSAKVDTNNKYANFDTDASVSYIPSGDYKLSTNSSPTLYDALKEEFETDGGCMDNRKVTSNEPVIETPTKPTTPSELPEVTLLGDANCDGILTIADATAIIQHLGNEDEYGLSAQGLVNADCYNPGDGVSGKDANSIQKIESGLLSKLPEIE